MTIRNKCKKSTLPSHSHGLKTFVVHTLFLTQKIFLTLLSSVSAEDANSTVVFVQSGSLFEILCKHSMHIHTVNIFIYMYYIYIYL